MSHEHDPLGVAFEPKDIDGRGVIVAGAVIFFGVLGVAFLLWPYFEFLKPSSEFLPEPRAGIAESYREIRQPLLQPSPQEEMQGLRQYEEQVLQGAGAQMSIERAMDIVAEKGLPPLPSAANLNLWQPQAGSRLTGFDRDRNRGGQRR